MDDLTTKISQILSDPDSMNQLRAAASALGLNPDGPPPGQQTQQQQQPPQQNSGGGTMPDLSALAGLLGSLGGGGGNQNTQPSAPAIDPKTIALMQGALSKLNSNDPNVALLRALKPHFTPARSTRVDDAIRLIQLFSMLPVLRDSGILGGLFGGGENK